MSRNVEHLGKKTSLFLDVVIEEEYDPFESNRHDVKLRIPKIMDPTKKAAQRRAEEDAIKRAVTMNPENLKSVPNGRPTLDVKKWATGVVEATPHGHFLCFQLLAKRLQTRCSPASK